MTYAICTCQEVIQYLVPQKIMMKTTIRLFKFAQFGTHLRLNPGNDLKCLQEKHDEVTAANVAVRAAVGGNDLASRWQLMYKEAQQKREGLGKDSMSQAGKLHSKSECITLLTRKSRAFGSGKMSKMNFSNSKVESLTLESILKLLEYFE